MPLWNRKAAPPPPRPSPEPAPAARGRRKGPAPERRTAPRYRPVRDGVLVGWWNGQEHFETTAGKVNDLSQGGARLTATAVPEGLRAGDTLWIRPDSADDETWCEARLIATQRASSRETTLRVEFPGTCRYDLYVILLYGDSISAQMRTHCVDPNFEDTRYWR